MSSPSLSNQVLRCNSQENSVMSGLGINRLLHLCSANLPVGGFSFSQGLEYAVEKHWITDPNSCFEWISLLLEESIVSTDLAVIPKLILAIEQNDVDTFSHWNDFLLACRETSELRTADTAMGKALIRLIKQLDELDSNQWNGFYGHSEISFVSAFAIAAHAWQISSDNAQAGYCWTIIDNQVAAATKLIPLGQTQGQNLLFKLCKDVDHYVRKANTLDDKELGGSLPRLSMASAWHETQYSRLFRS